MGERIVKSQALGDNDPSMAYQPKPVLEINIHHPVLISLRSRVAVNPKDSMGVDTADLLFESSAVASGYAVNSPQLFAQRMTRILSSSLENAAAPEPAPVEEEKGEASTDESKTSSEHRIEEEAKRDKSKDCAFQK